MKKLIILSTLICMSFLYSDTKILFYLNPAPIEISEWIKSNIKKENKKSKEIFNAIEKIKKLDEKTPAQISKKLLKNEYKKFLHPTLGGFLAIYGGYIDYSDLNGQISFPLRHTKSKLYLIITPNIKLIKVKGNTISHKELDKSEKENTQIYLFEKKEDKNNQFYWHVSKQETTNDKIINPLSVVILTKPKNLYVSTGDFISNDNKQLILPKNIYVINNNQNSKILLNFMNIKNFFEPIEIEDKKISDILFQKMITNN